MPDELAHKPAKKAAKKAAAKKAPHSPEKDARRAYEHLGRVRVLLSHSKDKHNPLEALLALANQSLQKQMYKQAAESLRAAEHLAFAALLEDDREEVSPQLRGEVEHELTHLRHKADDHAAPDVLAEPVRRFFTMATRNASECFHAGAFRSALEYARAAEALAHIGDPGTLALEKPASKRLAS